MKNAAPDGLFRPSNIELEMTDAQIKHMVDRFLSWKLPANFSPDNGVSFDPIANAGTPHESKREPVGTNLFDATQAEQLIRHLLEGLPAVDAVPLPAGVLPQFGYTGQSPDKGLVGFVNLQATEAGVRFTVRSEGEASVMATHDIPQAAAVGLLADALAGFVGRK